MGGLCSRRATTEGASAGGLSHVNGHLNFGAGMVYQSRGLPTQVNANPTQSRAVESLDKHPNDSPFSFPEIDAISRGAEMDDINDGIPRLSRTLSQKSRSTRSKQVAMAKVCSPKYLWDFYFIYLFFLHFTPLIVNYVSQDNRNCSEFKKFI